MSTPEAFANRGLTILTQWAQLTEQLMDYAAIFEARGGAAGLQASKYVDSGSGLTPEQQAYNDNVDTWANQALNVVTFRNALAGFYDATQQQLVNINRTDY